MLKDVEDYYFTGEILFAFLCEKLCVLCGKKINRRGRRVFRRERKEVAYYIGDHNYIHLQRLLCLSKIDHFNVPTSFQTAKLFRRLLIFNNHLLNCPLFL